MTYEHKEIPKSIGDRLLELLQSLQIVRDSLQAIDIGRNYQLIPLYGQMRALLTDKSGKPLLIDLAKQTNHELNLYAMPANDDSAPEVIKEALLHFRGLPVTLNHQLKSQISTNLTDFLLQPILRYKARDYRTKEIIEFLANRSGGAHYSTHVPKDLAEVVTLAINGEPLILNGFRQIAETTYRLGLRLIKDLVDFEAHVLLVIP